MLNHNDHAFVKVALDDRSLDCVSEHLDHVGDPLLRQLIGQALWNMVRDQQLRSTDYLPLVASTLTMETDAELIESALGTAVATIAHYVPADQRDEAAHRFAEVCWEAL